MEMKGRLIIAGIIVVAVFGIFFIPFIPTSSVEPCIAVACAQENMNLLEYMINYVSLSPPPI